MRLPSLRVRAKGAGVDPEFGGARKGGPGVDAEFGGAHKGGACGHGMSGYIPRGASRRNQAQCGARGARAESGWAARGSDAAGAEGNGAGRPGRGARAPRSRAGRGTTRGRRASPRARAAHGAREPGGTRRRGQLRRVWAPAVRRPGAASSEAGADREDARGRVDRRCGGNRRQPLCGHVLRLHGAGRHARNAWAPQEGPPVRDSRAPASAGRAVRRGRRRTPGRCGLSDRRRSGLPGLSPVWPSQRVWCRSWGSPRVTASRGTLRCSVVAT